MIDVAHEHAQVRGLVVGRRLGGYETRFDVERERPDGAAERAVLAAGAEAAALDAFTSP